MAGYFITVVLGLGLVLAAGSRLTFWSDLRRARRRRSEPRIGLLAPALFILVTSSSLVLVGLIGVVHEAYEGHSPPIPLDVIYAIVGVGFVAMFVAEHRRTARRRRAAREQTRREADTK